ncbi:hypothetical protein ACFONH_23035 [Streptomonospora nanhaiensis]|uniref:Secreted protein/lipoprotein n=1 Tax=Streptomonospora nanhaiensis TaxID=1323731 RepID=A0A853BKK6_9ACTN|nr:hypothetical protein [Streptomonospora nanhaiensis]NYI95066.1 hypothetical protein [Streptomonospora nanhaiensis]
MAAVSVLLTTVLVSCSGASADPPTETSASPSPSASAAAPEEEALAVYEGMWAVIAEQSRTTDPDYAALEPYATGQALDFASESLKARAQDGVVARGAPVHSPEADNVDAEAAAVVIRDCVDTTAWLQEDAESGELVEESPREPIRRQAEATVSRDGQTWKVSELLLGQAGSC